MQIGDVIRKYRKENNIVGEVNKRLKELGFEEVFLWVKEKILCKDCSAAEEKLLLK